MDEIIDLLLNFESDWGESKGAIEELESDINKIKELVIGYIQFKENISDEELIRLKKLKKEQRGY